MHSYLLFDCDLITGVAGLVGGKLASLARDNPETAKPLLLCTAASSAVGVATGICVAWYRKAPLHVYAISVGTNFAVSSFAFFSEFHDVICCHGNGDHCYGNIDHFFARYASDITGCNAVVRSSHFGTRRLHILIN